MARRPVSETGDTLAHPQYVSFGLFGQFGYDGVSLVTIAQAAGLTKSAMYGHFAGKQALYADCMSQLVALFEAHVLVAAETFTPDTGHRSMPDAPIPFVVDDPYKRFGDNEVLKGLSLTAHQGDMISLIGTSGSGKSTMIVISHEMDFACDVSSQMICLREGRVDKAGKPAAKFNKALAMLKDYGTYQRLHDKYFSEQDTADDGA